MLGVISRRIFEEVDSRKIAPHVFANERTEEIGREILSKNKQFLELNSKIIEAQHALMENLSSQSQPLLLSYDEAEAEQTGIIVAIMYRQGLIDGIKNAKLLNRTCNCLLKKFVNKLLKTIIN